MDGAERREGGEGERGAAPGPLLRTDGREDPAEPLLLLLPTSAPRPPSPSPLTAHHYHHHHRNHTQFPTPSPAQPSQEEVTQGVRIKLAWHAWQRMRLPYGERVRYIWSMRHRTAARHMSNIYLYLLICLTCGTCVATRVVVVVVDHGVDAEGKVESSVCMYVCMVFE